MKKLMQKFYLVIVFCFLYAPILYLMVFSFNEGKSMANWTGFSLKWYKAMFSDSNLMSALYTTLSVAALSAVIATIIGTLAAVGIHYMGKKGKAVLLEVNYVPIINPDIVTGISLMILFIFCRMKLGFNTLLLAHITFCIPYVVLSVLPKLRQMNKNLFEAALDLGATPMQAIRKVLLPEMMPGILTGMMLAFTISLDDFVVSFFTTGSGINNLSMAVFTMTKRYTPKINAVSTLMFAAVLLLLFVVNKRTKKDGNERGLL